MLTVLFALGAPCSGKVTTGIIGPVAALHPSHSPSRYMAGEWPTYFPNFAYHWFLNVMWGHKPLSKYRSHFGSR